MIGPTNNPSEVFVPKFCVWCWTETKLSKSHLIPESLGGEYKPRISCEKCNNFLGTKFEGEALNNNYIAAACNKLGIQSTKNAYRHGQITDEDSGMEMMITKKGKAIPKPMKIGKYEFRAMPKKNVLGFWTKEYAKSDPDLDMAPLEEFFNNPKEEYFEFGGIKHVKITHNSPSMTLKIDLPKYPNPKWIFKMTYEFLALLGYQCHSSIFNYLSNFVQVTLGEKSNQIEISDNVNEIILNNIDQTFCEYDRLEQIDFLKYHAFIARLSSDGILYAEVILFGQIRNFFILGKLEKFDNWLLPRIDDGLILKLNQDNPCFEAWPNIEGKDLIQWSDKLIETRFVDLIKQRGNTK